MKWQKRSDRYQVGDRVSFVEEDPYDGAGMEERHRTRYGKGPYLVEEIEDISMRYPDQLHPQFVIINGIRYSGAWFQPIEGRST